MFGSKANESDEQINEQSIENDSESEKSNHSSSDSESDTVSEGELERRRNDCIENLAALERQFAILRDQLYREQIKEVDTVLSEVRGGRSQEYLAPLQRLNEIMNNRKEVADIMKRLRLENIQHKFESEEKAAREHFESEKQLTMDALYDELMEKIRRLEEDRHFANDDWGKTTRLGLGRRKKAVTVSGPYIVYMLRDEEILDDWSIIRKTIKRTSNEPPFHQNLNLVK